MGAIWTFFSRNLFRLKTQSILLSSRTTSSASKMDRIKEEREKYLQMDIEEKRKLYKCKEKYVELSSIDTWQEYFSKKFEAKDYTFTQWRERNQKLLASGPKVCEEFNKKISIFTGDITTLEIDAIANAANESLLGGGGVDGAIHSAAGNKLRQECETLNGCSAGEVKVSGGYKLPAKYVFHTVGPRGEKEERLRSCYQSCMDQLKERDLHSLAFPCISTGIFGYPNKNAAVVALSTVRQWLDDEKDGHAKKVKRIIFCLFLKKDVEIYQEQMQVYFPVDTSPPVDTSLPVTTSAVQEVESMATDGKKPESSDAAKTVGKPETCPDANTNENKQETRPTSDLGETRPITNLEEGTQDPRPSLQKDKSETSAMLDLTMNDSSGTDKQTAGEQNDVLEKSGDSVEAGEGSKL